MLCIISSLVTSTNPIPHDVLQISITKDNNLKESHEQQERKDILTLWGCAVYLCVAQFGFVEVDVLLVVQERLVEKLCQMKNVVNIPAATKLGHV